MDGTPLKALFIAVLNLQKNLKSVHNFLHNRHFFTFFESLGIFFNMTQFGMASSSDKNNQFSHWNFDEDQHAQFSDADEQNCTRHCRPTSSEFCDSRVGKQAKFPHKSW